MGPQNVLCDSGLQTHLWRPPKVGLVWPEPISSEGMTGVAKWVGQFTTDEKVRICFWGVPFSFVQEHISAMCPTNVEFHSDLSAETPFELAECCTTMCKCSWHFQPFLSSWGESRTVHPTPSSPNVGSVPTTPDRNERCPIHGALL